MATVPSSGLPSVSASVAPIPLQHLDAPASAFGASVAGEALGEAGKTASQIGSELEQHAAQFQAVNNKVAADTASVGAVQALDKMRAEYQANNTGMAAYDNLPDFYKNVETTRNSFGENLSPLAKQEFDSASRRYVANTQSAVTGFAVEQRKRAVIGTSDAVIKTNQAAGAAAEYGTREFDQAVAGIAKEVAFQALPSQLGLTPEMAQERLHTEVGAMIQSQVKQSIDAGDYLKAQSIYADHKSDMTLPQIDQIAGALKVGAAAYVSRDFAQSIANGEAPVNTSGTVAVGLNADYLSAVHAREGSGSNPRSTATGVGQFVDKTWLSTLKADPQFANDIAGKSDAQILAMRSNGSLADRATLSFANSNEGALKAGGVTPTAATVGLAHGFGADAAIALSKASPNTPASAVLSPQAMAANPELKGETTGQIVKQFQSRFGTGAAPSGSVTAALPPPPKITPNMDPEQVRADYDTYITQAAHTLYGNNPVLENASIQAARARININIQAVQANQTASYNRLFSAIEGGNDGQQPRPLDLQSLSTAYPGAANDLATMPAKMQGSLGQELNRANSPTGAFVTPHMTAQAEVLTGMSIANPAKFAQTNLSQYDLSASDRKSFIKLQAQTQVKQAKDIRINTYLANPVVASIVKTNFPQKTGDDYNHFIGALQGQIDALQLKDGKAPSQGEIATAAQTLVTSKGGFLGLGATRPIDVPDSEATAINNQFKNQPQFGRDLSPAEISHIYTFNKARANGGR